MVTMEEFEALYRRTAPEVHAYLWRRVGDAAPDLVSDVYLIAWRRRRDLPAAEFQRAWLLGVARRLVLSHLRSTYRSQDVQRRLSLAPPPPEEPDDDTRGQLVRQALAMASEADRELIELTEWESFTVAEAAVMLGITAGAARVRLHRARQRLAANPIMQALVAQAEPADPTSSDRYDESDLSVT